MEAKQVQYPPRPLRVKVPVLVSFRSQAFAVKQFTLNLSEGGIFLPTDRSCPVGTCGTLKFRESHFSDPVTLEAEVVRTVLPEQESEGQNRRAGMGMRFLNLDEGKQRFLRRLVEGVSSGSIVQTIRRSIAESGRSLALELRHRPTDQKMMLALQAHGEEIHALIRDGNPSVLTRLLECPRLGPADLIMMLKNPNLATRVLSAIKRDRKWISNGEVRWLLCTHPNTVLSEAMDALRMLPQDRLKRLARDMRARPQIRSKAQELTSRRRRPGFR